MHRTRTRIHHMKVHTHTHNAGTHAHTHTCTGHTHTHPQVETHARSLTHKCTHTSIIICPTHTPHIPRHIHRNHRDSQARTLPSTLHPIASIRTLARSRPHSLLPHPHHDPQPHSRPTLTFTLTLSPTLALSPTLILSLTLSPYPYHRPQHHPHPTLTLTLTLEKQVACAHIETDRIVITSRRQLIDYIMAACFQEGFV